MFKKLLIVLVLLAGLVTWFLWEPHQQIRSVQPTLPKLDVLDAMLEAHDRPVRMGYVLSASQGSEAQQAAYGAFAIEWYDGRIFLVDAAMDEAGTAQFSQFGEAVFGADPAVFYGTVAQLLGPAVSKVRALGFTHLHDDHTGGIVALCDAVGHNILLFQTGWQQTLHNYTTERAPELIKKAGCIKTDRYLSEGLNPVPGFPGLVAISAGGHTPGSTIYAARINNKTWILAGDITNDRHSLENNLDKPWWYSWLLVPEDTQRLAELRQWLMEAEKQPGYHVVVSHDLDALINSGMRPYNPHL